MADIELKEQIDGILAMIAASEKAIREGASVDLKPLDQKVANLYESIASMRRHRGDMAREDLISSLDSILDRLDTLEQQVSEAHTARTDAKTTNDK